MRIKIYGHRKPVTLERSHVMKDINLMVMMFKIATLEHGPQFSNPVKLEFLQTYSRLTIVFTGRCSSVTLPNGNATTMLENQFALMECAEASTWTHHKCWFHVKRACGHHPSLPVYPTNKVMYTYVLCTPITIVIINH